MDIQIQRGRQFAGGTSPVELFDAGGKRGGWLSAAATKLVASNVAVRLRDAQSSTPLELSTQVQWDDFLAAHVPEKDAADVFAQRFGITLQDFIEVVDDAASTTPPVSLLDLSPGSALSAALSLDTNKDDYASKLVPGVPVELGGGARAIAVVPNRIGADILTETASGDFSREFPEQESWADFVPSDAASILFQENTDPAPFVKLYKPDWKDAESMAVVNAFTLPLHLEISDTNPDGTPEFQDRDEMFRETYYDDAQGAVRQAGGSVRVRVRFDDNPPHRVRRVMIQGKSGRELDPVTGQSAVTKFENRWEGIQVPEPEAQQALLTGRLEGKALTSAQKVYELAQKAGTLPSSEELRLEPQHLVLQLRRRTHLFLEPLSDVKLRRDAVVAEKNAQTQAGGTVPAAMAAYLQKLESQIQLMEEMDALLSKYGWSLETGETFIVSADAYSVYDPAARTTPPLEIEDEVGRVGVGLHVEAEWDGAHAISFHRVLEKIDGKLAANPPAAERAELEADRTKLIAFRDTFRGEVRTTVELMKNRLLAAGLELDPTAQSKDERAAAFMADTSNRPVYWL